MFERGAEWRKWDLHVHTPHSRLHAKFGSDFDEYAKRLLTSALANGVAAIGVTDYFSLQGYRELAALLETPGKLEGLIGEQEASRARNLLLIPNLELRSSVVIQTPDGGVGRVNFHVLFDPALGYQVIEDHFLRRLMFTAESNPGALDERWPLTPAELEALGARLKAQHPPFQNKTNIEAGMMNAVVAHEDVTAILEGQPSRFHGHYIIVVSSDEDLSAISWDSQGHQTRKLFIQKADMLFSSNKSTRAFALGRLHDSVNDYLSEFKSRKPCVHGSDAHDYDSLFAPAAQRHLWIKADVTFEGLRQLLFEPDTRVYIGEEPPAVSRVRERATKYVDSVSFVRSSQAPPDAQWFSGQVPLNPGLVAVIGNKGSGKSAFADVLGLLGDTRASEHFSFLKPERFLDPKSQLGSLFKARLAWCSGGSLERAFSERVDETAPETVKYIPQNYLEAICSELKQSQHTMFDDELKEVIFSHVDEADRLGQTSLNALIEYQTDETENLIAQLTGSLDDLNRRLVDVRAQLEDEFRKSLQAQLDQRQRELQTLDAARPPDPVEPAKNPDELEASSAAQAELDAAVEQLREMDEQVDIAQKEAADATKRIAAAGRLLDRIANLERSVAQFRADSEEDAAAIGVSLEDVLHWSLETGPIVDVRDRAAVENAHARNRLSSESEALPALRKAAAAKVEAARSKLDEPTRRYEKAQQLLAAWKTRREELEGDETDPGSVNGLIARLAALSELPAVEVRLLEERQEIVRDVFEAKERLLASYQTLYSPVQVFIDQHPVSQEQSHLEFYAAMSVDGFAEGFLDMIHGSRKGNFQGADGEELASQLVASSDFSTFEGVKSFLDGVDSRLREVEREGKRVRLRLQDQIRQHLTPVDVENYLFGLKYLRPRFELRWQGKGLDQLSPGERGNVLLVFYLLIDRRDVPLVIDQPEENLDNLSIASTLVPAIKYAKDRRQIVIVTHNPNLAVVCDAEQIIVASFDKARGNRVEYLSGAVESPAITKAVIDILEGTKPAFDLRDAKYDVLERLGA